jgi:hypothetical protein
VKSARVAVTSGLAALAAVVAILLAVFSGPGGRRAVLWSALVAVLVQVVAFSLARRSAPERVFKAVGVGALLRALAIVIYALLLLKPLGLPPVPALISLAVLFFVTTVLESWLLTS